MVAVKLCGLRTPDDIGMVNEVKATYAGFVFAPSKRQVTAFQAKQLIKALTHSVAVGVFVNEEIPRLLQITKESGIQVIQLHGDEDATYIQTLKQQTSLPIWKAIRLQTIEDIQGYEGADRLLLDGYHQNLYGGSGTCINTSLLANLQVKECMLAGGITIDNVAEYISLLPYGIDVSSGIEVHGKKDRDKIIALMKKIKEVTHE